MWSGRKCFFIGFEQVFPPMSSYALAGAGIISQWPSFTWICYMLPDTPSGLKRNSGIDLHKNFLWICLEVCSMITTFNGDRNGEEKRTRKIDEGVSFKRQIVTSISPAFFLRKGYWVTPLHGHICVLALTFRTNRWLHSVSWVSYLSFVTNQVLTSTNCE